LEEKLNLKRKKELGGMDIVDQVWKGHRQKKTKRKNESKDLGVTPQSKKTQQYLVDATDGRKL